MASLVSPGMGAAPYTRPKHSSTKCSSGPAPRAARSGMLPPMASKTHVDGNKVQIDDCDYTVGQAGAGQYSVMDAFGNKLGYFTVRGRAITPEDYGVEAAHPVVQIGRLWAAENLFNKPEDKSAGPPTRGVCRVA